MKAVQVIDGAQNCLYSIYLASDEDFKTLFPNDTDIQFIEDIINTIGQLTASRILARLWQQPIDKKQVQGIYGTIFYQQYHKHIYFPTRKEAEMVNIFTNEVQ